MVRSESGSRICSYDVVIIGGGVVGLWTALLSAQSGHSVALVESRDQTGFMMRGRNSGVLHGGIYYPSDSLKARHCARGRRKTAAFLQAEGVPYSICGKYVVPAANQEGEHDEQAASSASDAERREELEHYRERAIESGAEDVAIINCDQPFLLAREVLHVRCTGIVDLPAYADALERAVRRSGVAIYLSHSCIAGEVGRIIIRSHDAASPPEETTLTARVIVNAAGLYADTVAGLFGLSSFTVVPNKGSYFRLAFPVPIQTLVYPLKSRQSGFLGIHYTPDMQGGAWAGPNTSEASGKADFQPAGERAAFFQGLSRIVRGYKESDLIGPTRCGLRSRLFENGVACEDFMIREHPTGVCHLLGIESPGLTAAPSLAEDVLTRLGILTSAP